ncbi:MAG: hypothetical protein CMQ46_04280 [Gammaproteobacteria bacterium]|nr:hypothetical protein [Gammaproteobacteria bacterium]MBJ54464.1 hypothetical protein [Gammaproteobacteria bacterium]
MTTPACRPIPLSDWLKRSGRLLWPMYSRWRSAICVPTACAFWLWVIRLSWVINCSNTATCSQLISPFLSEHGQNMILRLGKLHITINWLVLLCFISSLGMFISLAFWQLDRAEEKRAMAQALEQRAMADPLPLEQAEQTALFGNQSRVVVQGEYETSISFLVTFQFYRGQAGFEVVTPFRLSDGSLALVSRGWLAPADDGGEPQVPEVSGLQSVVAEVYLPDEEIPPATVTDQSWPVSLSRLNVAQAGRLLGEPVYPYLLRLEADQPGVLARHWQAPSVSTRTHIGYAIQWFVITIVVSILALMYASNILELWRQRRHGQPG